MMKIDKIARNVDVDNQSQQILYRYTPENEFSTILDSCSQKIKFTKREVLCLGLYLQGMTAKEIGKKTCRSPRTIEMHVKKIREKLNANSRSEIFTKVRNLIGL